MNQKLNVRILIGLAAAAIFVVGFFLVQKQSGQTANKIPTTPLQGLKLSEDIAVVETDIGLPEHPAGSLPHQDSPIHVRLHWTSAESLKLKELQTKVAGKQLRMGGVIFVPTQRPLEDGTLPQASPEEMKAGKLSISNHILFVKGMYIGNTHLELKQPVYLTAGSPTTVYVTTWVWDSYPDVMTASGSEMVPALEAATQRGLDEFIRAYQQVNGPKISVAPIPVSQNK